MKFFEKIGNWWKNHKPTKRRLIQVYAALLTNANIKGFFTGNIYRGATKYACVPGLNCYSCPGAVGACPLGSLQNALASSGARAPYYVFGIILLLGLILGRTICGFLCPVGLGQELLYKIKTPKLRKSRYTRALSYLKYVFLAVFVIAIPLIYGLQENGGAVPGFCKYICPAGTFGGALGLLMNPVNADMFSMLGPLFTWKFCLLVAICVACVFIFRAFCRFFCPLGAIYGFFNKIALLGVKLDKNSCTDCGLCVSHCKMDVKRVGDHECINCGECMDVCPAKAISWKGSKLFLQKNAVEAAATERPLDFTAEVPGAALAAASVSAPSEHISSGSAPSAAPAVKAKPKRGKTFWLQVAAWAVALAVLLGALVYYNFIAKDPPRITEGNNEGDAVPDFTLPVYLRGEGETFTVSEQRGKVLILNFWTTTCGPCKQEIPLFERIAEEHTEDVTLAIVHGPDITEDVSHYITDVMGWGDYIAYFLQDTSDQNMYYKLGGTSTYPMTLLIDREGVIVYKTLSGITADFAVLVEETIAK